MLSPLLGIKTHFWEVGFRDAGPTHFSHLWPFFSRHSCAPSTLGRDLSVWQRGSLIPQSVFRTQLEFLKRNVSGYVCNPSSSRERDAASRGHTSGIPVSGCFIPEADAGSTAHVFMLPGRLRHPPWCLAHPLDRLHMCSERGHAGAFPKASSGRSVSFPRGTRVTYVTWEGLLTDEILWLLHSIFSFFYKTYLTQSKKWYKEKIGQRDDTQIGYLNWNGKLRLSE